MQKTLLISLLSLCATPALADCAQNFAVDGVPMVTALSYKSWDLLPKANAKKAVESLASAVMAEGFSDMKVDEKYGAISATQETSGSGRPQTLRIVARKSGGGVRVDAIFTVQPGQLTSQDYVRDTLCRIVAAASN